MRIAQILELAQNLKPQLHDLIHDADRAEAVDRQLTALIARSNAGEDVAIEIFDLLHEQSELSSYFLPSTPQNSISKGGATPPGNPAPIPASEDTPFKGIPAPTPPKTDNPTQK